MQYEDDIRIDETALDVEWLEQPSLMMKYARHCAQMEYNYDKAKEALDLARAELDFDIRSSPSHYDINKLTEAVVSNTIMMSKKFNNANDEMLSAKFEFNIAKNALKAFEQRKETLENMVRLHGQNYFAGPKIPRDLSWERKQKQKVRDAGVASRITRRK